MATFESFTILPTGDIIGIRPLKNDPTRVGHVDDEGNISLEAGYESLILDVRDEAINTIFPGMMSTK